MQVRFLRFTQQVCVCLAILVAGVSAGNLSGQELCKDGSFDVPLRWGIGASQVFNTGETIGAWRVKSGTIELLDRGGRFFKDTSLQERLSTSQAGTREASLRNSKQRLVQLISSVSHTQATGGITSLQKRQQSPLAMSPKSTAPRNLRLGRSLR